MSLWSKLPTDIVQHIYEFDSTYKEKFDESLNFIEHAFPTCCCDGGKKERYRHHYDIGQFGFNFWDWEWRRRNACPKHNPGDFDKNGNQTEYNWRDIDYNYQTYNLFGTAVAPMTGYDMVTQYQFAQNYNVNVPDLEVMTDIGRTFIYVEHDINFARIWRSYNNATINYAVILKSLWMFATRKKNEKIPIKTYSRKKLCGARFMDMGHDQRPIVA